MSVDENIVKLILQRKRRKSTKADLIKQYREEILALRQRGLSLSDICSYLESKYNLSVSPETLKKAVPELVDRVKRVVNLLSSLSCEELRQVAKVLKDQLGRCQEGK